MLRLTILTRSDNAGLPMTSLPQARFSPAAHVQFRAVERGALLVDVNSGACFQLNEVGAALWTRLASGETLETAIAALHERYDAPAEIITADVARLCGELLAAGLVDQTSNMGAT